MRNIRLCIEYDGTAYAGWQAQPNAPTIQQTLEEALANMTGHKVTLTGSGRTDAGVHAEGQVANFRTGATIPLKGFVQGLNSLLPPDISIRRGEEVDKGFDSRRSARPAEFGVEKSSKNWKMGPDGPSRPITTCSRSASASS